MVEGSPKGPSLLLKAITSMLHYLPEYASAYAVLRGMVSQAMAQMKPNSSRDTAVMTLPAGLPRAVRC